jgi:hypothetical protein
LPFTPTEEAAYDVPGRGSYCPKKAEEERGAIRCAAFPSSPAVWPDFDFIDKDHSGFITLPEMCAYRSFSDKECEYSLKGFNLWDKDHDGRWSKEEYERTGSAYLSPSYIIVIVICFTCYCVGRWHLIRRERALMLDFEQKAQRAVEIRGMTSEAERIDQDKPERTKTRLSEQSDMN